MAHEDLVTKEEEFIEWKKTIDSMSHLELAKLYRFAPSGHPVFRADRPMFDYFMERFNSFGGMTPGVSKAIGWGD